MGWQENLGKSVSLLTCLIEVSGFLKMALTP